MSLIGFLSKIPSALVQVGAIARVVVSIAKPILEALAPSVRKVDELLDDIKGWVEKGGDAAGAYLADNVKTIRAIGVASRRAETIFHFLANLCDKLDRYATAETPRTLTPAEQQDLLATVGVLQSEVKGAGELFVATVAAIDKIDAPPA